MRLDQVMPGAPAGATDIEVTDLTCDNRQVTPGTLFFCVLGFTRDGHEFAPEAIDPQQTFREMLDVGDQACVMEVSSHAPELHCADAINFAAAIFTNLTQDHLDFHPSMVDYFSAKRR